MSRVERSEAFKHVVPFRAYAQRRKTKRAALSLALSQLTTSIQPVYDDVFGVSLSFPREVPLIPQAQTTFDKV